MTRTLYGRANSSNVMKVVWLCEELGLDYERVDAGRAFGVVDTPEYRAMNPNGQVPTLREDEFVLWESNAILRYLAAGRDSVWPADPHGRAHVDQWMDWQQTVLNPPQSIVFLGLVRQSPAERDMGAIAAAAERLGRAYALLDAQLSHGAEHRCIVGHDLSLADIAIGVHVHRWFNFPLVRLDLPHLRAWYDRLLARPAYAAHVAQPLT